MKPYSIFIPVHQKDSNKLKYLIKSIHENLKGFTEIIVTSPSGGILCNGTKPYADEEILLIYKYRFKHRPNWMYQMYLKMFQDVTENDLYLTVDSDIIFNRPVPMFAENGKPILYTPFYKELQQLHIPYFKFQTQLLGLDRKYESTFITDTNFMSKKLIREMLARNGYTVESFIEKSFEVITPEIYPGEPEIWGQYIAQCHADEYEFRKLKFRYDAKIQSKPESRLWSDDEYQSKIDEFKTQDLDTFAIHSWYDEKPI